MTIGVDWIAFTLAGFRVLEVKQVILNYLGGDFVDLEYGGNRYRYSAAGPGQTRVFWSPGRPDVHVRMPGKAVAALTAEQIRGVLAVATSCGQVTRVDLCLDDFRRATSPRYVYEAVEQAVTHTDRGKWRLTETREGGATCYIGRRSSRQMLRVYDKEAESGGDIKAIRWELEFKAEMANYVGKRLVREQWPLVFKENLVRLVDFRKMQPGQRWGTKPERVPWFAEIVGRAEKAKIRWPEPIRTLEDAEHWIQKSVAPTLATVFEGRGGDVGYLEELLQEGRRRQKPRHRALLAEVRDRKIDSSRQG